MFKPRPLKSNSRYVRIFPELGRFDSDAQRGEAFKRAWENAHYMRFYIAVLLVWATGAGVVAAYVEWRFHLRGWFMGVAQGVLAAPCLYASLWLCRKRIERSLRQQLLTAGIPICIACGYDLTANESGRCPECGKPFRLSDWYMPPKPMKPRDQ